MKIVVDLQAIQAENRFRGIGRYSIQLLKHITSLGHEDEFHLLVNTALLESARDVRIEFAGEDNCFLHNWQAPIPFSAEHPDNADSRQVALDIQHQLIEKLQADVYFIPSLFEGFLDNAVVSSLPESINIPTVCICYDLIPLLYPEDYLERIPRYEDYYMKSLESLKSADHILAISEHTKREVIENLFISADKITNINAGVESQFVLPEDQKNLDSELAAKLGLNRPYFVYNGGASPRKNLSGMVEAFALLPKDVLADYQLLLVGKINKEFRVELDKVLEQKGLSESQVVFSGFVSDQELVKIYQHCFAQVFPSFHEGFGLPVLEAMACGAVAIASDRTSLPEVVGSSEALFDPTDVNSIRDKMLQLVTEPELRQRLIEQNAKQVKKFTWQNSAEESYRVFEKVVSQASNQIASDDIAKGDGSYKKLAMVTPMPPEQTGIADYVYELLAELDQCFEVSLIVEQEETLLPEGLVRTEIKNSQWFEKHAMDMDHIVYQMGNSPFHKHVLDWMRLFPGAMVLHDFYLCGLMTYLQQVGYEKGIWQQELFNAHGNSALVEWLQQEARPGSEKGLTSLWQQFPTNLSVIKQATEIIVHSEHARKLAEQWYGESASASWHKLPLPRDNNLQYQRQQARKQLGVSEDTLLVASFGIVAPSKLSHRVLEAWSEVNSKQSCELILVGKVSGSDYQLKLEKLLHSQSNVNITGWASKELYHQYLAAADIAVQLRTNSRGETSAAILDTMNYGLPTIANANGSMAEIDPQAIELLRDDFSNEELVAALNKLINDRDLRQNIGAKARATICDYHSPEHYVKKLSELLQKAPLTSEKATQSLLVKWQQTSWFNEMSDSQLIKLAKSLDVSFPPQLQQITLYLDITETLNLKLKTGIERYAKSLAMELRQREFPGFRVELVCLEENSAGWGCRTKRNTLLDWLGYRNTSLQEEWIEPRSGDVVLCLDMAASSLKHAQQQNSIYSAFQAKGTRVYATVFDLLPLEMPQNFPPTTPEIFESWLKIICSFDGALCISQNTADSLNVWLQEQEQRKPFFSEIKRPYDIRVIPMGVDLPQLPIHSLDVSSLPDSVSGNAYFLMVGTIEPRKGYLQVLEAFELLRGKSDFKLVIVGKEGWQGLPDSQRRSLPTIMQKLADEQKVSSNLIWLNSIDDRQLSALYKNAKALIAASEGEGFGLPLIEAAHYNCPVIARDIAVFREVADNYADFFANDLDPQTIANYLSNWAEENFANENSKVMPKLNSWAETADSVLKVFKLV